jgi:hypothetical protein
MIRRLFWAALGATVGVLFMRRLGRTVEAYTPAGLGRSAAGIGEGLRELAAAVREGMDEREAELRAALGVDVSELDPGQSHLLTDDPAARRPPRH